MSVDRWLAERLVRRDAQGQRQPPGAGLGRRWRDPDGTELAVIAQGDTFDVYIGRLTMYNVTLSARTALKLARWLFFWWLWYCWAGLKLRLWAWTQRRQYDSWRDTDGTTPASAPSSVGGTPGSP